MPGVLQPQEIAIDFLLSLVARMTTSEENVGNGNSDSSTPLLQRASSRHKFLGLKMADLLQDWWLWEICGAATAMLAILTIAVILVVYDSSSLPDWPSVFTVRHCFSLSHLFNNAKPHARSIRLFPSSPLSRSFAWVLLSRQP